MLLLGEVLLPVLSYEQYDIARLAPNASDRSIANVSSVFHAHMVCVLCTILLASSFSELFS